MFRDTTELRQPLAKEAMAVLTGVRVGVTDHVGVGVGDGQMAVHPLRPLNVVVGRVIVGTENDASITVLGDVFVNVPEVFMHEEPHSSIIPTDKCQDGGFV